MIYGEERSLGQYSRPFEVLKEWEQQGDRLGAALGFQALAMEANNTTLASRYFDEAMQAITEEDRLAANDSPPHQATVLSRALLNLAPVTKELTVHKAISEPDVLKEATEQFVYDLGKQARAAKALVNGPEPDDESLAKQRGGLISVFTVSAALGLLMRFQTDILRSNDWMATLAFLNVDDIRPGNDSPAARRWDISLFCGTKRNFELANKIYIRSSKGSEHKDLQDPNTYVVWIDQDLALPGDEDKLPGIELAIIGDLQSKTNVGQGRVRRRGELLLSIVDERTLESIRGEVRFAPTK